MLNVTLERRRVQYRRCLRSLAALALTWVAATNAAAQDKSPVRSFDIVQNNRGHVANIVMLAAVAPQVAWNVLTDFDNMHK